MNEEPDVKTSAMEGDSETVTVPPGWGRGQSTRSKPSNETRRCMFRSPAQSRHASDEVSVEG